MTCHLEFGFPVEYPIPLPANLFPVLIAVACSVYYYCWASILNRSKNRALVVVELFLV